jgi:glutamate decarboxylase
MFNFLNLGFEGYRRIALSDLENARVLSRALELSGYFKVLSNIHIPLPKDSTVMGAISQAVSSAGGDDQAKGYYPGLPVVAFRELC